MRRHDLPTRGSSRMTRRMFRCRVLPLLASAVVSLSAMLPALADNTVTLTILPRGSLSAGIADATLLPIVTSDGPQRDSGVLRLIVDDSRGNSSGWSVSITSSD